MLVALMCLSPVCFVSGYLMDRGCVAEARLADEEKQQERARMVETQLRGWGRTVILLSLPLW